MCPSKCKPRQSLAEKVICWEFLIPICIQLLIVVAPLDARRRPTIQIGKQSPSSTSTPRESSLPNVDDPVFGTVHHHPSNSYSYVNNRYPAEKQKIVFGAILPQTALTTLIRSYNKTIQIAVEALMKGRHKKYKFTNYFEISTGIVVNNTVNPNPTEILSNLCQHLLPNRVSTILYFTHSNSDSVTSNPAAAQYLMQMTAYLGIPIIAWNADNMGVTQVSRG